MTSQQSYRSIRSKTSHPSFLYIFMETETGLVNILLSNLCASEIYNLSVSLPGAGLNSVLPRCRLRQHFYRKAKIQVQKAMSNLQPEIWIPMQLAAKSFDERSVLFSGKLIEGVQLLGDCIAGLAKLYWKRSNRFAVNYPHPKRKMYHENGMCAELTIWRVSTKRFGVAKANGGTDNSRQSSRSHSAVTWVFVCIFPNRTMAKSGPMSSIRVRCLQMGA